MASETGGSKQALILAAGELFGEFGFDAVSTRDVSEKAQVNLGLIHYHFGSKENLYREALRLAVHKDCQQSPQGATLEPAADLSDPQEIAQAIREFIRASFREFLVPNRPDWKRKLVFRELLSPSSHMESLIEEIVRQEHRPLVTFYRRIKPHAPLAEAQAWSLGLAGQMVLFHLAQKPLLMMLGKTEYDRELINAAAENTVRAMLLTLEVPLDELPPREPPA